MSALLLLMLISLFVFLLAVLAMRKGLGESFASMNFGESLADWWKLKKARYMNVGLALIVLYWAMPTQVDAIVWPLGATKRWVASWSAAPEITTSVQSSVATANIVPTEVPVTSTPDVPKLRTGFQGFDKPIEDSNGDPKVAVKDVGGLEYEVIGAWQCWPIPPVRPYIQVRLKNAPGETTMTDVWVLRGALPEDDGPLAVTINSVTQHSGAVCQ